MVKDSLERYLREGERVFIRGRESVYFECLRYVMDNELVFRLDFLLRPVTTKSLVVGRKKGFLAV